MRQEKALCQILDWLEIKLDGYTLEPDQITKKTFAITEKATKRHLSGFYKPTELLIWIEGFNARTAFENGQKRQTCDNI